MEKSHSGDVMERLGRLESTVHEKLVPNGADIEKRTRFLERWVAMLTGAIGIMAFILSFLEKLIH